MSVSAKSALSVPSDSQRTTFALMGIAALLICNSHLEAFYPRRWMAADGLVGNLLFFLLSGYGTGLSARSGRSRLLGFVVRRVVRIQPSVILASLGAMGVGFFAWPATALETVTSFAWPTHFGYIRQIMIFYPLVWLVARWPTRWQTGVSTIALGAWLFASALAFQSEGGREMSLGQMPEWFWWTFYFLVCLAGALLPGREAALRPRTVLRWLALVGVVAGVYVLVKFELALRFWSVRIPAIVLGMALQVLGAALALLLLAGVSHLNASLSTLRLDACLGFIGRLSLQTYVLHEGVAFCLHSSTWPWPAKLGAVFLITIMLAWALRALTDWIAGVARPAPRGAAAT